jgi:hypothetical protein
MVGNWCGGFQAWWRWLKTRWFKTRRSGNPDLRSIAMRAERNTVFDGRATAITRVIHSLSRYSSQFVAGKEHLRSNTSD